MGAPASVLFLSFNNNRNKKRKTRQCSALA